MSVESAKAFMERGKTDKEFAAAVKECKSEEAVMAFVTKSGFDFTLDELSRVEDREELTDDDLSKVAGGYTKSGCRHRYWNGIDF